MAACSEDVCERDGEGANPSTTVVAVLLRAMRLRQYNTDITCTRTSNHFILWVAFTSWRVGVSQKKSNYIIIRMFKNNQNLAYVKQLSQMYVFLLSKVVWGEWDEFIIDEFSLEFKTKQFLYTIILQQVHEWWMIAAFLLFSYDFIQYETCKPQKRFHVTVLTLNEYWTHNSKTSVETHAS